MPQVWLPVVGYEGRYEVSNDGFVRSSWTKKIRKSVVCEKTGYERIVLWRDGVPSAFSVHRLVAYAFLGAPVPHRTDVAHNDGVRTNNVVENLRWATKKENQADRHLHGTAERPKGEAHGMSKLKSADVIAIRNDKRVQRKIAAEYGITQSQVSHIKTGLAWSCI